jgi:S-adenosylmethionine hydrolase
MIALFTDFGLEGPYTGQIKAAIWRDVPTVPIIDLFADAPVQRPMEAAYLLAAYAGAMPAGSLFLCVVDPTVGSERPAVAVRIDTNWFVGPGNGLFEPLLRRAQAAETFLIAPPAGTISASFHGRDLFAPVVARLAQGLSAEESGLVADTIPRFGDWPDDLPAIVYVDTYGNLMTGLRASGIEKDATVVLAGQRLARARTFSDVPVGTPFWYENANGLVEVAVNRGRADDFFKQGIGAAVQVVSTRRRL